MGFSVGTLSGTNGGGGSIRGGHSRVQGGSRRVEPPLVWDVALVALIVERVCGGGPRRAPGAVSLSVRSSDLSTSTRVGGNTEMNELAVRAAVCSRWRDQITSVGVRLVRHRSSRARLARGIASPVLGGGGTVLARDAHVEMALHDATIYTSLAASPGGDRGIQVGGKDWLAFV